jgi:hypothetical protein
MGTPLVIRKFRRNLRDYGLNIALRKTIAWLFGGLYLARVYRIYRINLQKWSPPVVAADGLEYRLITPEERDLIR